MKIDVVHPEALDAATTSAWRGLCTTDPSFASPLLGPDFAQLVGSVRPDARVIVLQDYSGPLGFLPFLRRGRGLARPMGAPFSDYHALVSRPGSVIDVKAVFEAAGIGTFPFSGLVDPAGHFAGAVTGTSGGYQISLGAGGAAAYLEMVRSRSAKRFKNWRRLEHKLEREAGPITLSAPDHDPEAFELLQTWKREQLHRSGLQDVLRPAWVQTMMRRAFEMQSGDWRGLLITLRAQGRPIAAHFGVRLGRVYHPWIAAFDPAFAEYSVGNTHLSRAIAAMDALGLDRYDLASGSDHYKHCYASTETSVAQGMFRTDGAAAGEGLWGLVSGTPGSRRALLIEKVRVRLDHIAATEISPIGRLRGVLAAAAAVPRRSQTIAERES